MYEKEKVLAAIKKEKVKEAALRKAELEKKELQNKPKTLDYPVAAKKHKNSKNEELYRMVNRNQYAKNTGKKDTEDDPEYLKQKHECTGKPSINDITAHIVKPDRDLTEIWGVEM